MVTEGENTECACIYMRVSICALHRYNHTKTHKGAFVWLYQNSSKVGSSIKKTHRDAIFPPLSLTLWNGKEFLLCRDKHCKAEYNIMRQELNDNLQLRKSQCLARWCCIVLQLKMSQVQLFGQATLQFISVTFCIGRPTLSMQWLYLIAWWHFSLLIPGRFTGYSFIQELFRYRFVNPMELKLVSNH